ncbi:PRA1 family protein H [Striga hermonthica]|uniref:PRA1 family protein H n=1 Tax=Striga hermonthica TaxID=68872 RepID=A0A9N7RRH6_STRHE|nr:PRA1 family protein H [Striga hermonthica]
MFLLPSISAASSHSGRAGRSDMVFDPNPLSLSVPEPPCKLWLRGTGYLKLLSRIWTLLSLLTFTPFSKLATGDFTGTTPS